MQKTQVEFSPNQPFLDLKDSGVWHLVDITEVQSLVLKASGRTIVHLMNKENKKMRRLRFAEFETQFEPIQSNLIDRVLAFNKLLNFEATNHFD